MCFYDFFVNFVLYFCYFGEVFIEEFEDEVGSVEQLEVFVEVVEEEFGKVFSFDKVWKD